jgi:hypothetical protein
MVDKAFQVKNGLVSQTNTTQIGTTLYISSAGNVGLGDATPAQKLSVNGFSTFSALITGKITNSVYADTAGFAANAGYAANAGLAANAVYATNAYYADFAGQANNALFLNGYAASNLNVNSAIYATFSLFANQAQYANIADIAIYAYSANVFTGTNQNSQFNSLGVGTPASGVTGTIIATNDITAYYGSPSDERLKENIQPIPNALEKLSKIKGYLYTWNEAASEACGKEIGKREAGLLANEVEKVMPELVATREDGYKGLHYDRVVALLVQAINELHDKVEG